MAEAAVSPDAFAEKQASGGVRPREGEQSQQSQAPTLSNSNGLQRKFSMLPELQEKHVSQIFNTYLAVRKAPGNSVVVSKVHQKIVSCTTQSIFSCVTPLNSPIGLGSGTGGCFVSKQFASSVFSPTVLLICISYGKQENSWSFQLC